jgi:MFS transporter, PHS family, inorganic phosphate transporter
MYGMELIIMIVATFGLTFSATGQSVEIVGLTIFWRVILGIGIGGGYPNSSVLVSEFSTVRWRGAMVGAVFAAQGFGATAASFVGFLCIAGFKNSLQISDCDINCRLALDKSWRIIYGLGMVPAVLALWFRLTIPETIRYTLDISRNEPNAVRDAVDFMDGVQTNRSTDLFVPHLRITGGFEAPPKASVRDFIRFFGLWKNGKVLLGTAGSWFLLDIAFVRSPYLSSVNCKVRNRLEYLSYSAYHWI